MLLTEKQKTEIKDYIIGVPKYRETYNELYDHIVNSLEDSEVAFSIDEVVNVVNRDFGGFSEVVYQEEIYHKEISKKYNRYFRAQFVDTLKWYGIFPLAFCLMIYFSNGSSVFNTKPMLLATVISCMGVAVLAFVKIFINRIKYSKFSILDNYLALDCSFGLGGIGLFLQAMLKENIFNLDDNGKLIATLTLHFICVIYVRTFMKIYKAKFKILAA
ncbi:MAG: hypothetical protein V4663_19265 [Bacteroidota bacterium]